MQLEDIQCGNGAYKPESIEDYEVEGVRFLHLVIEVPQERLVPRDTELHSFYLWKPGKEEDWAPMPIDELDRLRGCGFDLSVPACNSNDEQEAHLEAMNLLVEDSLILIG
ncbi:MAG TPA: hypothetical protein VMH91_03265 [Candidatus Paceibacterota bacterium]|nr:hypothetical protein [Candidatus Paceibacterota bacterium]